MCWLFVHCWDFISVWTKTTKNKVNFVFLFDFFSLVLLIKWKVNKCSQINLCIVLYMTLAVKWLPSISQLVYKYWTYTSSFCFDQLAAIAMHKFFIFWFKLSILMNIQFIKFRKNCNFLINPKNKVKPDKKYALLHSFATLFSIFILWCATRYIINIIYLI